MITITGMDHLVLTVASMEKTLHFYTQVLGMRHVQDGTRHQLHFGKQKINIHSRPGQFQPAAMRPTSGSADICFVATEAMPDLLAHISQHVPIEVGPVARQGACGPMQSLYVRDPDGNLVEICTYAC